ncbi:MAG: hypothetical protein ACRDJJ_10090 [Actinomycetota bacterium]
MQLGRGEEMLFGLGLPEWLTIIALVGGLFFTFWVMARGSIAYEKKRRAEQAHELREETSS